MNLKVHKHKQKSQKEQKLQIILFKTVHYHLEIKFSDKFENMEFKISPTLDNVARIKLPLFSDLISETRAFFESRNYGNGIKEMHVAFICALPSEGFQKFYKEKKTTFVELKKIKNKFTGLDLVLEKVLIHDVKLSPDEYDYLLNASDLEGKFILSKRLLDSTRNIALPKKVGTFNWDIFLNDLEEFHRVFVGS